jgi:hypothetical protein
VSFSVNFDDFRSALVIIDMKFDIAISLVTGRCRKKVDQIKYEIHESSTSTHCFRRSLSFNKCELNCVIMKSLIMKLSEKCWKKSS